jgi:TolA-binding protein
MVATARILAFMALLACPFHWQALAATLSENNAFSAAARAFQDGSYERAEREFGEFSRRFPKSARRAEVVLLQAQSRFHLKNLDGALQLLADEMTQAGKFADEYHFWTAEASFQKGGFEEAAAAYARVVHDFPRSKHALAALHGQALALFRQKKWSDVTRLLSDPDGLLQLAVRAKSNGELVSRCQLLLGEALLEQGSTADSEKALLAVPVELPSPEMNWRRLYLLSRAHRASGKGEQALQEAVELGRLGEAARNPRFMALAASLQGALLEEARRLDEAVAAYEKNLSSELAEERRQALLKVIELTLSKGKLDETVQKLELFTQRHPQDPALDIARLTLGEVRLKQFYALGGSNAPPPALLTPAQTNLLQGALTNFTFVITTQTNSPQLGNLHLQRGWCNWNLGKLAEAQVDFQEAAQRLSFSEEQALARFKAGEAAFQLQNYTNAITNFWMVVNNYTGLPNVKDALVDQALYKILRAGVEAGDMPAADEALKKVLEWYPNSFFSERGLLLHGQAINRLGQPAEARAEFESFVKRFGQSPLVSEVRLAIARTHVQEMDWSNAAKIYDQWVVQFPNHPALTRVEYDRAWVHYQTGDDANALNMFTNFVARFPNEANAPLAQNWIAGYFFNRGQFDKAEENYQRLFQNTNWPADLKYEARLAAGRAAFARLGFADARKYFTDLVSDEKCPMDIMARALFALGDTLTKEPGVDPAKPLEKFADAINAFTRITQAHATNRVAPLAWGRIGNCNYQLGQEPGRYELALQAYTNALQHPLADFFARSLAEIGLGLVREKQKQPTVAIGHYQNVFYYEGSLREGEQPDPHVIKEAGLSLARLLEEQQHWNEARNVYASLMKMLPILRPELEKKIERTVERMNGNGN